MKEKYYSNRLVFIVIILTAFPSVLMSQDEIRSEIEPVDYIDTIIGTSSSGRMYTGANMPFGMVQLAPDTRTGEAVTSGYDYSHKTIEGFSMNHMSGVGWFGTLGNFQAMPTVGKIAFHSGTNVRDIYQPGGKGWESDFRHDTETTQAGYYKVKLDRYNIWTELTCTSRVGFLRFTFPKSDSSNVQVDLSRKIGGRSERQRNVVVDNGTIKGWIQCNGVGRGFAGATNYTLYYYAQFNKKWDSYGLWNKGTDLGAVSDLKNEDLGFYATFSTDSNEEILMKVGISYVSMEGAQANLEKEINHWNFDAVSENARTDWNNAISVAGLHTTGGTKSQKTIFYTGLYHAMLFPCDFADVDGRYFGADKKIHQSTDYTYRMCFSGWDVFRHAFPLLTVIRPDVVNDEINTFLEMCDQTGKTFPKWEMTGDYTDCMIGDPGVSVVVDAYMKGIRNYDINKAYDIARRTATGPKSTRNNMAEMNSYGYVPGNVRNSISITLENVYADWCISRFADSLGKTKDAAFYRKRSFNYKSLFDPSVGWMRRKDADGNWMEFTDRYQHRAGSCESNTFQQTWFVPQDVQGLADLMGEDKFRSNLDELFECASHNFGGGDCYRQGNEPDHHVVSLYNYVGQPWKTQYWTRQILERAYGSGYNGLCGSDDVGQMSAWYVLNAIGLSPVGPGDNLWNIGSPIFDEIAISLDPKYHKRTIAKTFKIKAENNSVKNVYIQSAKLNGKPLNRPWITHNELISGGILKLVMGPSKSRWGSDRSNWPPSLSNGTFPPATETVGSKVLP
ncbi:MAG: GH92 family glycosyl hydrolase [Planctomycetota bacterium]|jgi:predicted alpha-1,2-mannosidase